MLYTNFLNPVWYTLKSDKTSISPARFLLKPLPYKLFTLLQAAPQQFDNVSFPDLPSILLPACVVSTENVLNFSKDNILDLPLEVREELIEVIMQLFVADRDFMETLELNIELMLNPRFSGETWDCTTCQAKKLDYQRNCPYLPAEEHDPKFFLQLLDEKVSTCPINRKDTSLVRKVIEARNIESANLLPEAGGVGDQTTFYVMVSQRFARKIKEFEAKALEEARTKRK